MLYLIIVIWNDEETPRIWNTHRDVILLGIKDNRRRLLVTVFTKWSRNKDST